MKERTEHPATGSDATRAGTTEQERQQMIRFGITAETKTLYSYEGYVYERLHDALAYAEIDAGRRARSVADGAAGTP